MGLTMFLMKEYRETPKEIGPLVILYEHQMLILGNNCLYSLITKDISALMMILPTSKLFGFDLPDNG